MWGLSATDADRLHLCQKRQSLIVSQRTFQFNGLFSFFFLFSLFSSSLSFKCIYWLPIGCRSILLKPINFLCLGLLFLDQKSPRLLSPRQIDSSTPGLVPRSESLFPAPPASNDSSALPGGNSSIMAGCLTGRSLMTGALYWPDCHTLKIWSQSSF